MARFIAGRLLALVLVLWTLVTILFVVQAIVPDDPARMMAGPLATERDVRALREELGLDEPLTTQYVEFLKRAVSGDLSESLRTRQPVRSDLEAALPATLELVVVAALFAGLLGGSIGLLTARRRGTVLRALLTVGASVPTFCLGLLALLFLYSKLGWFPAAGRLSAGTEPPDGPTNLLVLDGVLNGRPAVSADALWHLTLPALCLALGPALAIARTLRSSLMGVRRQDYVRTARAKGLTERRVLLRHCLRNASSAPLTMFGLQLGAMIALAALVETIFAWPGLGRYAVGAISANDFPAIIGVTLVIGAAYVLINAVVDAAQLALDPRLRAEARWDLLT
jgi:peptide/nickel transport system permease protein